MIHFELESDREVTVSGVGVLLANTPIRLSNEAHVMFKIYHGTEVPKALFPPYVKVTAVWEEDN